MYDFYSSMIRNRSPYGNVLIQIGDIKYKNGTITIDDLTFDADEVPYNIENYNSRVQSAFWSFCHDSARDSDEFKRYADKILSKYNVYLDKIKNLTDKEKFEIRANAQSIGKTVAELKSQNIDYFSLKSKSISKLKLYTLNASSSLNLDAKGINSLLKDMGWNNSMGNNIILIKQGNKSYLLMDNDKDVPKLNPLEKGGELSNLSLKIIDGSENKLISRNISSDMKGFLYKLTAVSGNYFYPEKNLSNLNKNTFKLAKNLSELGIKNSLHTLLGIDNSILKELIDSSSKTDNAIKLLRMLKEYGYSDILNFAFNKKNRKKSLYLVEYSSRIDNFKKIVDEMYSIGNKNSLKTMLSMNFDFLEYLTEYNSRANNFNKLITSLDNLNYSDPCSKVLSAPRDRYEYITEYDSRLNLILDLFKTLSRYGCSCPWETMLSMSDDNLESLIEYKSDYNKQIQKATKGISIPNKEVKSYLSEITASKWKNIFHDNSYIKNIVNLYSFSDKNVSIPKWMLGLNSKYINMMSKNHSGVSKLINVLNDKKLSPFKTLVDLGPVGFKMAMERPSKLAQKLSTGGDINKIIKGSWDYEEKPVSDMFVSVKSYLAFKELANKKSLDMKNNSVHFSYKTVKSQNNISKQDNSEIPKSYCCDLTNKLMSDPVFCILDHRTYDRKNIEKFLKDYGKAPYNNSPLGKKQLNEVLFSNGTIKEQIEKYLSRKEVKNTLKFK